MWTHCSASCGPGSRLRMRTCSDVTCGGRQCLGEPAQAETCKIADCPGKYRQICPSSLIYAIVAIAVHKISHLSQGTTHLRRPSTFSTTRSPSTTTQATSPAATGKALQRRQLVARGPAVRDNAQPLELPFAPLGCALKIPEVVKLFLTIAQEKVHQEVRDRHLAQLVKGGVILSGALVVTTSAK